MKRFFFIIFISLITSTAIARHIAGGELYYEYIGIGNGINTNKYKVTLRLFRDCASTGPRLEDENVNVGIYENGVLVQTLNLPRISMETLVLNTAAFPCLTGNVSVCYEYANYSNIIDLPVNVAGYTLARYGCCRIGNITNTNGSNNIGNTYVTKIPGTNVLPTGYNNSPRFNVKDTALVCSGKQFKLDFGAVDVDNDVMTYSFCDAYSASSGSNNAPPSSTLNLISIPYSSPFSGSDPLGGGVQINGTTGIISGVAPGVGQYVVSVCITEWRNNIAITEHRKDFILNVQNCDYIEADLPDKIIQCDSFSVYFENQSSSSSITSYLWNFGEPSSPTNISTAPTNTHTYADTGKYKASLVITGPNGCTGKDSTEVIVYPGFFPSFTVTGSCYQTPFYFRDTTKTNYGIVNSWIWDFGETTAINDTSTQKIANYIYPNPGSRTVKLKVGSSKGCEKTITKDIVVSDKPSLVLPFRDTLICSIDTLPLVAIGNGNFSWSPNFNISSTVIANPYVFPKDSITYYVTLTELGCVAKDSIKVNVLDFITVDAGLDSSICRTDTFKLHPTSYALAYLWTASTGENVSSIKYPTVKPLQNTWYYVTANLGKCQDKDSVFIKSIPYPKSVVGVDSSICFGDKAYLHGNIVGSSFLWTPSNAMQNANTLNPMVVPSKDTWYYLIARDTLGCPKPFTDSILITVIKPVLVNAGRDTSVVRNQPLQLKATSNYDNGVTYLWSPATWLNNASVFNPIATINQQYDALKYKVKVTLPEGCVGEDEIVVKVFSTEPDIFVPTGFTPNGDGKNDILKPICVGISQLNYFKIFNRWGQLIYETNEFEKGWNGTFNNIQQGSGTYIFVAQGVDFTGKVIYKKGTTVLIR